MTIQKIKSRIEEIKNQLDWMSFADRYTPAEARLDRELRIELSFLRSQLKVIHG